MNQVTLYKPEVHHIEWWVPLQSASLVVATMVGIAVATAWVMQ